MSTVPPPPPLIPSPAPAPASRRRWLLGAAASAVGSWLAAPARALPAGADPAVRPQDDLFRAANGAWLDSTEIPPDKVVWGSFTTVEARAAARVRQIVEDLAAQPQPPGSDAQKIASFYRAFMDEAALDRAGLAPLQPWLDELDALRQPADLAPLLGRWQGQVVLPLQLDVQPDANRPQQTIAISWQGGLGLPDRDYYLQPQPGYQRARAAYAQYLSRLLQLGGDPQPEAHAAQVLAFETRLARSSWSEVDNRNPHKVWNPQTLAHWQARAPGLDWARFLAAAGLPGLQRWSVSQPSQARAVAQLVAQVPLATWRLYLRCRLLDQHAKLLPAPWREAQFAYRGQALGGSSQPAPRWQQALDAMEPVLGEAIGQFYVARHFPPAHLARIQAMVAQLRAAFGESIDQLAWMSPATRARAREKLALMRQKIGHPSRWRDYSALQLDDADAVGNAMRAGRFEHLRLMARLGRPVDRDEWLMSPQTVNAYYNAATNEVIFPAAMLEPPFFDMAADDAQNYGAIGAIIGHEISHGFDDQGAQFDGEGRLRNWWTAQDRRAFERLGQRLVAQYNGYEALPGHRVNGQLTLGENIADLSGVQVAFRAWRRSLGVGVGGQAAPQVDGLTGEQRFFYGYAMAWRSKVREPQRLQWLSGDPHAPDEFRANGVAVNLDAFHHSFGTRPGDRLYRPPARRIRFW